MKIDLELARYIRWRFPRALTELERRAHSHELSYEKATNGRGWIAEKTDPSVQRRVELYYSKGWLTRDPAVLELLKPGFKTFMLRMAERVLREQPEDVYLNLCPVCGTLAHTPFARQCPKGHHWRENVVAAFMHSATTRKPNNSFELTGTIKSGEIAVGNSIDLTFYGLPFKSKITGIDNNEGELTLTIEGMNDRDADYFSNRGTMAIPLTIER